MIFVCFFFFVCIDLPDIQSDQRRIEHIESLTGVLRDLLEPKLMLDATEFAAIYGRVK